MRFLKTINYDRCLCLIVIAATSLTIAYTTICVASVQAQETFVELKDKQSKPKVVKIAGTYKVVLEPQALAQAKKEGFVSVTGQWQISPNGAFSAALKLVKANGEVSTINTTGRVRIISGKVVSQVERLNGEKPKEIIPTQSYTLLSDEITLQADGQPVRLVRIN